MKQHFVIRKRKLEITRDSFAFVSVLCMLIVLVLHSHHLIFFLVFFSAVPFSFVSTNLSHFLACTFIWCILKKTRKLYPRFEVQCEKRNIFISVFSIKKSRKYVTVNIDAIDLFNFPFIVKTERFPF